MRHHRLDASDFLILRQPSNGRAKKARLIGEPGRDYPGLPGDSVVVRRMIQLGHRIIRKANELQSRDPKLASWLGWQGLRDAGASSAKGGSN